MVEGMGWSVNKFYKIKKILTDNNLIETVIRKSEDWKIEWKYVKVNFLIQDALSKNDSMEKPKDGKLTTNAWSNINKTAWSNKYKYKDKEYDKQEIIDFIYSEYRRHIPRDRAVYTKSADSKLQIEQLMKEFSVDDLMNAQVNYFKKTSHDYVMACQYFYSNKKWGKTYRPFIDHIEKEKAPIEAASVNFEELF